MQVFLQLVKHCLLKKFTAIKQLNKILCLASVGSKSVKLMLQTHSPYRERTPDGGKPHPSKSSASWSFSELGCSEPANICSAVSFVVPPFLRTVLGREMCAVGDGGRQRLAEDRWAQVGSPSSPHVPTWGCCPLGPEGSREVPVPCTGSFGCCGGRKAQRVSSAGAVTAGRAGRALQPLLLPRGICDSQDKTNS